MANRLKDLAGLPIDQAGDEARQLCISQLGAVLKQLQHQGQSVPTIISALAVLTIDMTEILRRN